MKRRVSRRSRAPRILAATLDHHLFALIASLGALARKPWTSGMTVAVMAIALALPSGFYVLLENVQRLTAGISSQSEITVFMTMDANAQTASALAERFAANGEIAAVDILDPEAALTDFADHLELGDALDSLTSNPMPFVLVFRLAAGVSEHSALALSAALNDAEGVEFAQFDMAWLIRFNALVALASRLIYVIGGVLFLALIMIVGNTIRLDIENRREEIEITKLLGATNGFIRRPFLYSGLWYGLASGLVAALLITLAIALLRGPGAELAQAYQGQFQLHGLGLARAMMLVAAAAIIGWTGSFLALARHLKRIQPR